MDDDHDAPVDGAAEDESGKRNSVSAKYLDRSCNSPLPARFLNRAGSPFMRGLPTLFMPGGFFAPLGRPRPCLGGSDIVGTDVEAVWLK